MSDARTLYAAVQAEIAKYPSRRAAILPALRLAQEALRLALARGARRSGAMRSTSRRRYCQSVASFYDMFFLEPVGAHVIEVCTNLSCALCGAGEVWRRSSTSSASSVGETTADGTITLRKVECLGGCGWAPVVAVDERYHERFRPEDAAALVADVRARPRVQHG